MSSTDDDGGLRGLFRTRLVRAHWTSVETGAVSRGVPDAEYCFEGAVQGWVEYKAVRTGWAVRMRPEQIAWLGRRARYGGRCYVAVRRVASVRSVGDDATHDELWLFPGGAAAELKALGLRGAVDYRVGWWEGGPARWNWTQIEEAMRS